MLTPEQKARQTIDQMLEAAGWQVQTRETMNRTASLGVAVCEFPLTTGEVDYLLFADGRPIGVVEAKAEGTTTLTRVYLQHTSAYRTLDKRIQETNDLFDQIVYRVCRLTEEKVAAVETQISSHREIVNTLSGDSA